MQKSLNVYIEPLNPETNYQMVKFDGEFDKIGFGEVHGELDMCVEAFSDPKNESKKSLVFDFTNLKFINSESIGYVIEVHAHLVHLKKELVVIGLNDHVADVFKTIGISEIIPVYPNLDDFLNKNL